MKVEVTLVKAFSQDPEKGNPAGVVLNADALTFEQWDLLPMISDFSSLHSYHLL